MPYVYRGLLKCDHCGLSITPEKHKGHVYYHCTQYRGKHGAQWLREEEITRQMGEVFKNLQVPSDIMEKIVDGLNTAHHHKMEIHNKQFDKLTRERKTLSKMMDNLYLDKLKGNISDSEYERFYSDFCTWMEELLVDIF